MSEILRPKMHDVRDLTDMVLSRCLHEGDVVFANGERANNHLDIGYSEVPSELRNPIADLAASMIIDNQIRSDFIATVPTGADGWGDAVAMRLGGSRAVRLKSQKITRREFANTSESERLIESLKAHHQQPTGIVIDDATSDGGTSEAYADFLVEQGMAISLVMSIFYRGKLAELQNKYPRATVLAKEIPVILDWSHNGDYNRISPLYAKEPSLDI